MSKNQIKQELNESEATALNLIREFNAGKEDSKVFATLPDVISKIVEVYAPYFDQNADLIKQELKKLVEESISNLDNFGGDNISEEIGGKFDKNYVILVENKVAHAFKLPTEIDCTLQDNFKDLKYFYPKLLKWPSSISIIPGFEKLSQERGLLENNLKHLEQVLKAAIPDSTDEIIKPLEKVMTSNRKRLNYINTTLESLCP